jgi:hypothetical protein
MGLSRRWLKQRQSEPPPDLQPSLQPLVATEASTVQIEYVLRGATFGKTLEQLDAYGTIENLPYVLDSPVWAGNRSILAAFDTSAQIWIL